MPFTVQQVYSRLVWSADVPDVATLLVKLDEMPGLQLVKIDRLFVDTNGYDVFGELRERGKRPFFDAKDIEIPVKLEGLAKVQIAKARPWMLNCMAGGESSDVLHDPNINEIDGLKRFADVCHVNGVLPCAVTVLTTKKPDVVQREFNGRTFVEQVLYYVDVLNRCGFTDIVCSPEETTAIRTDGQFDHLKLNTPGVRPAGSAARDQARINTPAGALRNGASRIIIGRPITDDGLFAVIVNEMLET